jgi:hypothetical protein
VYTETQVFDTPATGAEFAVKVKPQWLETAAAFDQLHDKLWQLHADAQDPGLRAALHLELYGPVTNEGRANMFGNVEAFLHSAAMEILERLQASYRESITPIMQTIAREQHKLVARVLGDIQAQEDSWFQRLGIPSHLPRSSAHAALQRRLDDLQAVIENQGRYAGGRVVDEIKAACQG